MDVYLTMGCIVIGLGLVSKNKICNTLACAAALGVGALLGARWAGTEAELTQLIRMVLP